MHVIEPYFLHNHKPDITENKNFMYDILFQNFINMLHKLIVV